MHFFLFLLFSFSLSLKAQNSDLDQQLNFYIKQFNLSSPAEIKNTSLLKFNFGRKLFSDPKLSLAGTISCQDCHHPKWGTSDGLPFSIGQGGKGLGRKRKQLKAGLTPRSAPPLYNRGHNSFRTMFWDGRILYNAKENTYQTPEPGLNGKEPKYKQIRNTIENVLAMQALFPMVSIVEMRGFDFASLSNKETWDEIESRIKQDPSYERYINHIPNFNIGHIANALSHFQTIAFQVNNTPFDQYLQGDKEALSLIEKKGALLFMEKGRCVNCHNGPLLSNMAFQNVAVPQIGKGKTENGDDPGRYLVFPRRNFRYGFLTQPLRNIALTAPFMHNGFFQTLKEVVKHYNHPQRAFHHLGTDGLNRVFSQNYNHLIEADFDFSRNQERLTTIAPVLRRGALMLSQKEVNSLVCFLKKSLTQKKFYFQLSFSECY